MKSLFFTGWACPPNLHIERFKNCETIDTTALIGELPSDCYMGEKLLNALPPPLRRKLLEADHLYGWSTGAILLLSLADLLPQKIALTLFSPSLHFCPTAESPLGTPFELIDAMKNSLRANPHKTVIDFHKLCATPNPEDIKLLWSKETLEKGLDFLKSSNIPVPRMRRELILYAGRFDRVIHPKLSIECAASLETPLIQIRSPHYIFNELTEGE